MESLFVEFQGLILMGASGGGGRQVTYDEGSSTRLRNRRRVTFRPKSCGRTTYDDSNNNVCLSQIQTLSVAAWE